jgi:hypothetical protein
MTDDTPKRGRGRPRIDPAVKAARETATTVARVARHRAGTVRRTLYVDAAQAELLDRLVEEHGSASAAVEAAVTALTKT